MRLRIEASINPAGFSDADIARLEIGLEDVRGRLNRDLTLLGNLARERAGSGVEAGG